MSAIEVQIRGQKVALRSSSSDPELVKEVLALVSDKLRSAESRASGAAAHQVVLLALLDVAESHVQLKRRAIDWKDQVEMKTTQLLSLLEDELK